MHRDAEEIGIKARWHVARCCTYAGHVQAFLSLPLHKQYGKTILHIAFTLYLGTVRWKLFKACRRMWISHAILFNNKKWISSFCLYSGSCSQPTMVPLHPWTAIKVNKKLWPLRIQTLQREFRSHYHVENPNQGLEKIAQWSRVLTALADDLVPVKWGPAWGFCLALYPTASKVPRKMT